MSIKDILNKLPESPGIYLMKDGSGKVIYVGKAVSLKRRVRSYFQRNFEQSPRVAAMVSLIRDIEWKTAATEATALLMESNAIKKLRPRFNVLLMDDKSYPYLRLTSDTYPRLESVRRPYHGRGETFGPFMASDLKETLKLIHELFPLRYCEGSLRTKKPCIYYEMKSCLAPCIPGQVSPQEYGRLIGELKLFLKGKKFTLLRDLEDKMWDASARERYEDAAVIRERLDKARNFINQVQTSSQLRQAQGEMVDRPAKTKGLGELQAACGLPVLPRTMEAFDISHIQGAQTVASLVVFKDGVPSKKDYRRFRIKTVKGIDDFASMAEVVGRRYRRLQAEQAQMPDLVVVDGGKGQLHEARKVLDGLGLEQQPVISLAKREEEIFIPGQGTPVKLPRHSAGLHLIQWLRDEAHRFAIRYHRVLRDKGTQASILDGLPGIGEQRKQALLSHFGSVEALRAASVAEIGGLPGFSEKIAKRVKEYLENFK